MTTPFPGARLTAAARGESPNAFSTQRRHDSEPAIAHVSDIARRLPNRLKRCRHCGIRVPRDEMVYGFKACSDDCADEIWIREQALLESITE